MYKIDTITENKRYRLLTDYDDLVELNDGFTKKGYKMTECGECDGMIQCNEGYEYEYLVVYQKKEELPTITELMVKTKLKNGHEWFLNLNK